ncbi:MAG: hypothetical protein OSB38_42575 [Paraburkholderia fungorum]|nr:hypothetical protein [Paraburkholderia fungorum]
MDDAAAAADDAAAAASLIDDEAAAASPVETLLETDQSSVVRMHECNQPRVARLLETIRAGVSQRIGVFADEAERSTLEGVPPRDCEERDRVLLLMCELQAWWRSLGIRRWNSRLHGRMTWRVREHNGCCVIPLLPCVNVLNTKIDSGVLTTTIEGTAWLIALEVTTTCRFRGFTFLLQPGESALISSFTDADIMFLAKTSESSHVLLLHAPESLLRTLPSCKYRQKCEKQVASLEKSLKRVQGETKRKYWCQLRRSKVEPDVHLSESAPASQGRKRMRRKTSVVYDGEVPAELQDGAVPAARPDRAAPATLQDGAVPAARPDGAASAIAASASSSQHDPRTPLRRHTTTPDPVALAGRECSEAAGCSLDGEAPASSKQDGEATAFSDINDPLVPPRCLVVHRFFHASQKISNVAAEVMELSLRSFASRTVQIVWMYSCEEWSWMPSDCAHIHYKNAAFVYPKKSFDAYLRLGIPIQQLKDRFQFACLTQCGGYWADFDVMLTGRDLPAVTERMVVYAHSCLHSGREAMTETPNRGVLNVGFMGCPRNNSILLALIKTLDTHWKKCDPKKMAGGGETMGRDWTRSTLQRAVMAQPDEMVLKCDPSIAYPLPNFLSSWDEALEVTSYGGVVPSLSQIFENSVAVNVWLNVWNPTLSLRVARLVFNECSNRQQSKVKVAAPAAIESIEKLVVKAHYIVEEAFHDASLAHRILSTAMSWARGTCEIPENARHEYACACVRLAVKFEVTEGTLTPAAISVARTCELVREMYGVSAAAVCRTERSILSKS